MSSSHCKTFREVVHSECESPIRKRRKYWQDRAKSESDSKPDSPAESYPESDGQDLAGLALSGGGIRSAMFNLGLLQSFQRAGLMKHIDYLASVSGGGYTNGYYSTLGNFRHVPSEPDVSTNIPQDEKPTSQTSEPIDKLSARDAQFLLEGQYLNHPIEFITDYLRKTSVIVATAIASLFFVASIIALYFRFFDYPSVRRWLELLDISSDLRVGIFASLALAGTILLTRFLLIKILGAFRIKTQLAPGQWVVYVVGVMCLGVAIMIGNGDFYVSTGGGILPEKLDFKSIQLPMTIVILMLFFPMLRFSSLLRSEKVNATVWQKLALWVVLFGTSWGTFLAAVGWIGKENISGFIDNRPPKFEQYDILNYGALARLLKKDDLETHSNSVSLRSVLQAGQVNADLGDLETTIEATIKNEREIVAERSTLRAEQREWDSWLNFSNQSLSRWASTISAATSLSKQGSVAKLIAKDYDQYETTGPKLCQFVEAAINPAYENTTNQLHPKNLDESIFKKERSRSQLTYGLLQLAVHRVTWKQDEKALRETSDPVLKDVERLMNWIEGGGKMIKKDRNPYKDLGNLNGLMRKCWLTPDKWDIQSLSDLEEWRLNRMFLEIGFPDVFKERAMVSTSIVVAKDQEFRLTVMIGSLILAAVCIFFLDFNRSSAWFHFYRKRIGETFLKKAHRDGLMKLRDLAPTANGYPYPLFVSALLLPQAPLYSRTVSSRKKHTNPTKLDGSFASNWYSFVFSPLYCGWLPTGTSFNSRSLRTYRSTNEYLDGELHVDQAVVLSGAAMTPFMSENSSLRFLMHLFNIRLEQWLPNPSMRKQPSELSFSLIDLAKEWTTSEAWGANSWRFGVVADGGFREFLGVEELIARRCKIVVVSDAGCNNGLYEFGVLAELIRKLRLDHCIEVYDLDHDRPLDTRRLKRPNEADGHSPQHFVLGRIRYPEKVGDGDVCDSHNAPHQEALLVYVQMSLTGDEDIDIAQFRRTNPQFPDEPISNQFYSRDQVESFRQLGEHIGSLLCRDVSPFNCPATVVRNGKEETLTEQEQREWRIRTLGDAFRSSYRNECRQESIIANDDARIGWMVNVGHVDASTTCQIYQYESVAEHQILVRDFVWNCLEDYESEHEAMFATLKPTDLFGIAIECNRRHAGFRPEWPTAFFQVTGRDLLVKASQLSVEFLSEANTSDPADIDKYFRDAPGANGSLEIHPMLTAISRLAVMLPRGVFRLSGVETGAEVLVCMIAFIIRYRHGVNATSLHWIRSEAAQVKLRKAIETGKAPEVALTLQKLYNQNQKYTKT